MQYPVSADSLSSSSVAAAVASASIASAGAGTAAAAAVVESPLPSANRPATGVCLHDVTVPSHQLQGGHRSPPMACLKWCTSLHTLLQDKDGIELFRQYLNIEGKQHADALDFWFACEGLKKRNCHDEIMELVKIIKKKYFVKSALPISEDLRKEIVKRVESSQCLESPITIYDKVQSQIENLIATTTYVNFLKSDLYLQYIENAQLSNGTNSSSSEYSNDLSNLASALDALPILHEDTELMLNAPNHHSIHNPDYPCSSGLSLSSHSDARTRSDTMSYVYSSLARWQATVNKESHMNQYQIPRTQRVNKNQCQPLDPKEFASILKAKLDIVKQEQENEFKENETLTALGEKPDEDQSILDDHISMVFPDTPGRSSPRTRHQISRKRKDGSTYSIDSGNVHDFAESTEWLSGMVKSKSVPGYQDDGRFIGSVGRRSSSRRTLTDLTDSGISVISDTHHSIDSAKDSRLLARLMAHEMSSKQRSVSYRASSATSPTSSHRHKKGFGSRSSSVERNSGTGTTMAPPQPIMNLNIASQMEEARRRSNDMRMNKKRVFSSRHYPEFVTQSSQSTLRKSQRGQRFPNVVQQQQQQQSSDDVIVVMFSFCDEQFPYRTKIPGSQITLKQFKEYLPKKGNYRYFFKTICEELGNQVIQEEVTGENDILPLWEGKIMAQVKSID